MGKTNQQVVELFRTDKEVKSSNGNLYARDGVLYSYGTHFPLAIRREPADSLCMEEPWWLLNGDRRSITTNRHQWVTQRVFSDMPRVAFSAIRPAGLNPQDCILLDFWKDTSGENYVRANKEIFTKEEVKEWHKKDVGMNYEDFKKNIPVGATYYERTACITLSFDTFEDAIMQRWHRIGAVLLSDNKYSYLCSMDEGRYFVSKLPTFAKTLYEAFECLKPIEVKTAENIGISWKRQGEWFFIPVEDFGLRQFVKYKKDIKRLVLPAYDSRENRHLCTQGITLNNYPLVTGRVKHVRISNYHPRGIKTHEHRDVILENIPHFAVKNLSLQDWSAEGRVD